MKTTTQPPSPPLHGVLSMIRSLSSMTTGTSDVDSSLKLLGYTSALVSLLHPVRSTPLAKGLTDLQNNMSLSRYAIRLVTGLPTTAVGCFDGSWAHGPLPDFSGDLREEATGDGGRLSPEPIPSTRHYPLTREAPRVIRAIESTLPYSMIGYYPFEAIAYAGWMCPELLPKSRNFRDANRMSQISCWFWLYYVVVDLLVQAERVHRIGAVLRELPSDSCHRRELEAQLRASRTMMTREALHLLPAVHWSRSEWATKPWLSDRVLNTLMWAEAAVCYGNNFSKKVK